MKNKIVNFLIFLVTIVTSLVFLNVKIVNAELPARMYIDVPFNNQVIENKDVIVSGWATDSSGIKKIDIFLDNVKIGEANYGSLRLDVNKVFPGYPSGNNSGYSYIINMDMVSTGKHQLKVISTGNSGNYVSSIKTINVTKMQSKSWIDYPKNNETFENSDILLSGWALNSSGIKQVEVYLDDRKIGQAAYGQVRADVNKVFPGYPSGDNGGYSYTIDIDTISTGSHIIKTVSIGNDGNTVNCSRTINVSKLQPRGWIDVPNSIVYYNGIINIKGWAVNDSGIKDIKVYFDNALVGSGEYGVLRADVNKVFPGYPSGDNSGFLVSTSLGSVKNGNHSIMVEAIGTDGTSIKLMKDIDIINMENKLYIDAPSNNTVYNNSDIVISGWALNLSGVKQIDVYIDNKKLGKVTYGQTRTDVNKVFPGYPNGDNSGYSYTMDVDKVSPGIHTIKLISIGNDGTTNSFSKIINVNKIAPRMNVETPKKASTYYYDDLTVSGWAVNASSVKQVNIYYDNVLLGNANYGSYRPDVNKVYPGYQDGANGGFYYTIDKDLLSSGTHSITVEAIGNDGTITKSNTDIKIEIILYSNYNYTIETMVGIQKSVNAQIYKSGSGWISATTDEIMTYVNPVEYENNNTYKYQFMKLAYTQGANVTDINNVLSSRGVLKNYGQSFINGACENNVNVLYLVAHALLETGNGSSKLATGVLVSSVDGVAVTPKVVYNMYGINAIDSDPIKQGAEYAYKKGWFTINDAIVGGAEWISIYYINNSYYNQNTIYKMRWNPNYINKYGYAGHQYATDVRWPFNQTYMIKYLAELCPTVQYSFEIPKYK
ncbi:MAG: Ig-like domain-containing protein [Clostridiaceae bacterium]